jgi:hypothetical protein
MLRALGVLLIAVPCSAQSTARDSAIVAKANAAKAKLDSANILSTTPLANYCRQYSTIGWFKNGPCVWQSPLLSRTQTALADVLSLAKQPVPASRVDTLRFIRVDTLRLVRVDTVRKVDTVRVVVHDTVRVTSDTAKPAPQPPPAPAPVPVDTTPKPGPVPAPTPAPVDTSRASPDVELPRVFLNTDSASMPSNGRVLRVAAGGNLQAALDSARSGDRIVVACVRFTGNFTYGVHQPGGIAGQWITVQPDCAYPAAGVRMSPSAAVGLPKLVSTNGINTLASRPSAARWHFVGLEITVDSNSANNQGTVLVGDASEAQNALSLIPSDIVLDRLYIHGQPNTDMRKCVALNSARTAIVDSYVSECHSGFDAQAITGTNGPGPFKIVNNYLEGAAENIAWGGADPHIAGLVPSDIEIRRNHLLKPLAWKDGRWLEKNVIESKNSTRVLVEGNVLENSWNSAQQGYSFALWSVNQDRTCTWCVTSHWTIRNNVMKNVSAGVNITAVWDATTAPAHHIAITNNAWTDYAQYAVFQMDSIPYLTIEHNTGFGGSAFNFGAKHTKPGQVIRNNITGGYYGISAPWGGGGNGWAGVGSGVGSVWMQNVVQTEYGWDAPPADYAPKTRAEIGFVTTALGGSLDALVLSPTSPYKNKGTDGKDLGADIAAVKAAIAGVVRP